MNASKEQAKKNIVQKEGFFPSDRRWLFYRCWHTMPKRGEILAIHNISDHSERYQELGNVLANNGYDFYIFDITGHGRSEGIKGHVYCFEEYLVDIVNFYAFLRKYRKMESPFILGHGVGAILAALFAVWGQCPTQGVILCSPLLEFKNPISFWKALFLKTLSFFYPTYYIQTFISEQFLTHDSEILEDYTNDPMIQKQITIRCFFEIKKAIQSLFPTHLNLPCLMLHGEEDSIADIETSKQFFQKIPVKEKEFYMVSKGYHELLHEMDRGKIFDRILDWLMQQTKPNLIL